VTELDPQPPTLEQRTLLLELHHRVNNEFSSAINFISVAAVRTDNAEAKTALSEVVELLHQYADVHRALKMPDRDIVIDAGEYLRTLCRSMSRSKLERAGVQAFACGGLGMASCREVLATGNDRPRARDQCCTPCIRWRRWRD
jgi:two-component sensor histidine kinase